MHWVGTSGFQYPEWKGKFYPVDLSAQKMLPFYAQVFSTTEINYSFRRIPSESTISKWAGATPAHFKFSFKAPQRITHFAKLVNCQETLDVFLKAIAPMDQKLGVVLFQLPPQFKKDAGRLTDFLPLLPRETKCTFEFRHESWFDDEVFGMLDRHNVALCIAENEEFKTPRISTADFGYLRLRREDYTPKQLREWAEWVESQKRWREALVYFKHEETAVGPNFATAFMKMLRGD